MKISKAKNHQVLCKAKWLTKLKLAVYIITLQLLLIHYIYFVTILDWVFIERLSIYSDDVFMEAR